VRLVPSQYVPWDTIIKQSTRQFWYWNNILLYQVGKFSLDILHDPLKYKHISCSAD